MLPTEGRYFTIQNRENQQYLVTTNGKDVELSDDGFRPGGEGLWFFEFVSRTIRHFRHPSSCLTANNDQTMVAPYNTTHYDQKLAILGDRVVHRERDDCVLDGDIEGGIKMQDLDGNRFSQRWNIEHAPPRVVHLVHIGEEKVLDVEAAKREPGTDIILYEEKEGCPNQGWYEDKQGVIRSFLNHMGIEVDGQPITAEYTSSAANMQWCFVGNCIYNPVTKQYLTHNGRKFKTSHEFTGDDEQKWTTKITSMR